MDRSIQDDVRDHYGASARKMLDALDRRDAGDGGRDVAPIVILPVLDAPDPCCAPAADADAGAAACCDPGAAIFGPDLYATLDRESLPDAAVLASLGCGNPTAVADLRPGETVLDLGSGGGIDVLLSARRVGPSGRAIGLDMTDDMLELARRNAAAAGATNVEFVRGTIEAMPLADASVDVVISNCVINLSSDKDAVFREIARVLRPGGRMGVSDVVAEDELSDDERRERGSWAACYAGALSFAEYRAGLEAVGLEDVEICRHTSSPTGCTRRSSRPAKRGLPTRLIRAPSRRSRPSRAIVSARGVGKEVVRVADQPSTTSPLTCRDRSIDKRGLLALSTRWSGRSTWDAGWRRARRLADHRAVPASPVLRRGAGALRAARRVGDDVHRRLRRTGRRAAADLDVVYSGSTTRSPGVGARRPRRQPRHVARRLDLDEIASHGDNLEASRLFAAGGPSIPARRATRRPASSGSSPPGWTRRSWRARAGSSSPPGDRRPASRSDASPP